MVLNRALPTDDLKASFATMTPRTFLFLHLGCSILGALALWWFVFSDKPDEAIADTITASAIAGYVELTVMRLGG
jgi:hypothetical protein